MEGIITYRGTVYPWQCDQVGHMNVMFYVGKFDEGTWHLFATAGLTPSYFREQDRGMVAVQQNITYRRECHAGDVIEVESGFLEVREKAVKFQHLMRDAVTREIVAFCELTGVHLDRTSRKSCPFPPEIASSLRARILTRPLIS